MGWLDLAIDSYNVVYNTGLGLLAAVVATAE